MAWDFVGKLGPWHPQSVADAGLAQQHTGD